MQIGSDSHIGRARETRGEPLPPEVHTGAHAQTNVKMAPAFKSDIPVMSGYYLLSQSDLSKLVLS